MGWLLFQRRAKTRTNEFRLLCCRAFRDILKFWQRAVVLRPGVWSSRSGIGVFLPLLTRVYILNCEPEVSMLHAPKMPTAPSFPQFLGAANHGSSPRPPSPRRCAGTGRGRRRTPACGPPWTPVKPSGWGPTRCRPRCHFAPALHCGNLGSMRWVSHRSVAPSRVPAPTESPLPPIWVLASRRSPHRSSTSGHSSPMPRAPTLRRRTHGT